MSKIIKKSTLTNRINDPFDLENHLPFRIAVVSNLLMLDRDCSIMNRFSLGARELRVIVNVGSYMPITSADVAYQSKMDTYTVSRAVKSLVEKGLVIFEAIENNRRDKNLVLTDAGIEVYHELTGNMAKREKLLTEDISANDLNVLNSLLAKFADKAESILASNAKNLLDESGQIPAEQKELIRWYKKTQKQT